MNEYYDRALELVVSRRARDAFALDRETDQVRERYGRNTFGQSCLLARRLVEAGARVVEVIWPKVGIKRGFVYGESDKTGSGPLENPVHPRELLATIYHAFGIDPSMLLYNHLNQPRELVKGAPVTELFT